MKYMYRQYLVMAFGALAALPTPRAYANNNFLTGLACGTGLGAGVIIAAMMANDYAQQSRLQKVNDHKAIIALYDDTIKKADPYHAVEMMIRSNPKWMKWISDHLNYLDEANEDDAINMDKQIVFMVTEGKVYDIIASYQRGFLSEFIAYCRLQGHDIYDCIHMNFIAYAAREGRAFPACGFHFNSSSHHSGITHTPYRLPDYRTWYVDDSFAPWKHDEYYRSVSITVDITDVNPSGKAQYKVELKFHASKYFQREKSIPRYNV